MNIVRDIKLERGPEPIYAQIENNLERKIKSGKLPRMYQLPTETEMARQLKLNRLTVRQAYTNLKKKGFIQSLKAKGTFVLYDSRLVGKNSKKTKARSISVILPHSTSSYKGNISSDFVQLGLIRGISEKCSRMGRRSEILHMPLEKGAGKCAETIMDRSRGAIFIIDYKPYKEIIELLSKNNFHYMVAYGAVDEKKMNRIYPAQNDAAYKATEYLISLGHKRIAMINGDSKRHWGFRQKSEGYKKAMKENKCRVADNIVELFENTPENTRNATLKFLNGPKPPTAFLCSNDLNLKGVVDAINEKGLRIPDDISVITFDAGIYGNTYPKPITSMDTEYYKIGEAAVELLSEIKDGAVAFPVNKITEIKMTFGESVSRPGEE